MPVWLGSLLIILVLAMGAWTFAWQWGEQNHGRVPITRRLPLAEFLIACALLIAVVIASVFYMRVPTSVLAQDSAAKHEEDFAAKTDTYLSSSKPAVLSNQRAAENLTQAREQRYYECVVRAQENGSDFKAAKGGCASYWNVRPDPRSSPR